MSRTDWLVVLSVALVGSVLIWGLGLLGWILDALT